MNEFWKWAKQRYSTKKKIRLRLFHNTVCRCLTKLFENPSLYEFQTVTPETAPYQGHVTFICSGPT